MRRVNGSALKEIPITELRKTVIFVPSLEVQKKIVDILITIENNISCIQQMLLFQQQQKSGLMQKLLTGEWRVNTEKVLEETES